MKDPEKLAAVMRSLKVGSDLKLRVFHEGKYRDLHYVLPERPLLPGDLPEAGMYAPAPDVGAGGKAKMGRRKR